MAKEKLSTQDILALARKQDGGRSGASTPAAASPPAAPAEPAEPAPAEGSATAAEAAEAPAPAAQPPAAKPKSTAEILAAARAQGGGKAGGTAPGAASPAAAKPKPSAAPQSTADILAAARAQKGPGAAVAASPATTKAAAKPAAAKASATKSTAVATADAGDRPPLHEMVRALHEGRPLTVEPPKPRLPARPPVLVTKPQPTVTRRAFPLVLLGAIAALVATPFAAGWLLMAVLGGLWTLLTARFMMPNMVVELPSKFKVGPASDFPGGTVSEKYKASRGVWIVNSDAYNGEGLLYALASVCTHLGCTPNWLEGEQKFKCPCHGSGFYISGINFEGPAPRPLERVGLHVAEDGMLEVDKSVKFQEELGQWQDPKSFVEIG